MVISRAESGEEDAQKDDSWSKRSGAGEADDADDGEGEIRNDVPEIGDAEEGAPVGEGVIGFVLREGADVGEREDAGGEQSERDEGELAARETLGRKFF